MVVVDTQTLTTMSWFVDSESRASEEARVSPTRCRNDGNKRTRKKKKAKILTIGRGFALTRVRFSLGNEGGGSSM